MNAEADTNKSIYFCILTKEKVSAALFLKTLDTFWM